MDLKGFDLFHRPQNPENLPVARLYNADSCVWVLTMHGDVVGVREETFDETYQEYEGDMTEHFRISPEYHRIVELFTRLITNKKRLFQIEERNKEIVKENVKLKRENKILKVLTENNKQGYWKPGIIIEGRVAECTYCKKMLVSEEPPADGLGGLPFFEHTPEYDTDRFYCGCRGWD